MARRHQGTLRLQIQGESGTKGTQLSAASTPDTTFTLQLGLLKTKLTLTHLWPTWNSTLWFITQCLAQYLEWSRYLINVGDYDKKDLKMHSQTFRCLLSSYKYQLKGRWLAKIIPGFETWRMGSLVCPSSCNWVRMQLAWPFLQNNRLSTAAPKLPKIK